MVKHAISDLVYEHFF